MADGTINTPIYSGLPEQKKRWVDTQILNAVSPGNASIFVSEDDWPENAAEIPARLQELRERYAERANTRDVGTADSTTHPTKAISYIIENPEILKRYANDDRPPHKIATSAIRGLTANADRIPDGIPAFGEIDGTIDISTLSPKQLSGIEMRVVADIFYGNIRFDENMGVDEVSVAIDDAIDLHATNLQWDFVGSVLPASIPGEIVQAVPFDQQEELFSLIIEQPNMVFFDCDENPRPLREALEKAVEIVKHTDYPNDLQICTDNQGMDVQQGIPFSPPPLPTCEHRLNVKKTECARDI